MNGIEDDIHEQMLIDATKDLLKTAHGKHFLRWLIDGTGSLKAAFTQDIAEAAFKEGQRAVGFCVLALVVEAGGAQTILKGEDDNE